MYFQIEALPPVHSDVPGLFTANQSAALHSQPVGFSTG
jgi:hypothetical protein